LRFDHLEPGLGSIGVEDDVAFFVAADDA